MSWVAILLGLLCAIAFMLWRINKSLGKVLAQLLTINRELNTLRTTSRARIGEMHASGMTPEGRTELELRRLGRDSRAKRVVVGGDPESEQSHMLGRRAKEE